MEKRSITILVLASFILACLMVSGAFADKDEIVFDAPDASWLNLGKVTFTHKKHYETLKIDCLRCHHNWKQSESSGKLCRECHKKAYSEGKVVSFKDALHHKTCKGCHEEAIKVLIQQQPSAKRCNFCHVMKGKMP